MSKIVYRFNTIYDNCKNLEKYADDMQVALNNYQKNAIEMLTWEGKASDIFKQSLQKEVKDINNNINQIKGLALFMRRCAEKYDGVERKYSNNSMVK